LWGIVSVGTPTIKLRELSFATHTLRVLQDCHWQRRIRYYCFGTN